MDAKGKERGILKLEPRPRVVIDTSSFRSELTPQGSYEYSPSSPQPSVDRLSVTWADPGSISMASSGVNLFHLPSETPVTNEVKFSSAAGDGSEDEDYSASLSAVLRQRRASVRRSRKGRARRPSSPFLPDENRPRRRSSVFTTSSGDTAISMEEAPAVVTQEQIFENIHLHKEVLGSVKQQPLGMRRKLKIVNQAKTYIKRHEGQLQERLAQSKRTKDIYARFNILIAAKWQQLKREAANTSNLLIPWELRIKEIESHFGSVVASYFTFLRWLFWVNLVIGFILLVFVIVPEYLTASPQQDGERKTILEEERRNASNLLTLWEFEGILKYSPIFYGYYSNIERPQYRMPLAYFLTGLVVYIYSFVAILRKMAENSRMSKLSEKEDECIFSWKLFTGWDFMIGNAETAHNRIASVILGFKEALLEEAEKKKDLRNWRIISLRAVVNICVVVLLAISAYAVVHVVSRPDDTDKHRSWWRENETTTVVTVISITFPVFFELLGLFEHYHPRKQLRLQLARIMLLNLLNLYSLTFALLSKIDGMSKDLDNLKPSLNMNILVTPNSTFNFNESMLLKEPGICVETIVPCGPCILHLVYVQNNLDKLKAEYKVYTNVQNLNKIHSANLIKYVEGTTVPTTASSTVLDAGLIELEKLRNIAKSNILSDDSNDTDLNAGLIELEKLRNIAKSNISIDDSNDTNLNAGLIELEKLRNIAKFNITFYNSNDSFNESEESSDDYDLYDDEFGNDYFDISNSTSASIRTELTKTSETISSQTDVATVPSANTDYTSTYETENDEFYLNNATNVGNTTESVDFTSVTETTETGVMFTDTNIYNTMIYDEISTPTEDTTEDIESTFVSLIETDTTYGNIFLSTKIFDEINSTATKEIVTSTQIIDTTLEKNTVDSTEHSLPTTKNIDSTQTEESFTKDSASTEIETKTKDFSKTCRELTFNCSVYCGDRNITQVFIISKCTEIKRVCYETKCENHIAAENMKKNQTNVTMIDIVYLDENNIKHYNLTIPTRKKLLKLCWETMFGQELVKLTMMDLVFVLLGTLFMDFFRALFVRYMNKCWCWDLEKKFPEYGDFKIAENILHLINNQGMVWMGMFFSPGLVVLNVVKLMIMMYLRSWAVMTCNVPHEVVFRVSKSNNFYLALLLTMLFLCVLPVGYTIVCVKPSWHCGPFSEYEKIYYILTSNIYKILPKSLYFTLEYIASPAIVIPLLVLLILIIYYLTSLTNSLREANNDLKIQLRRERTEERRKMFQLADNRRRAGSSAMDNTPFARWKKALPSLPLSKSIDSDDRKTMTGDEVTEPSKVKKRGGIFAKIVNMALDKKSDVSAVSEMASPQSYKVDDETDTEFHETLPSEILKIKDITISKPTDSKKKNSVDFKTINEQKKIEQTAEKIEETEKNTEPESVPEKHNMKDIFQSHISKIKSKTTVEPKPPSADEKKMSEKQTSESSTQSKQSDSIGSVIPVIMISTTESDEEVKQTDKAKKTKPTDQKTKEKKHKDYVKMSRGNDDPDKKIKKTNSDQKPLRRQSSVDSIKDQKSTKDLKTDDGHKYQYSL